MAPKAAKTRMPKGFLVGKARWSNYWAGATAFLGPIGPCLSSSLASLASLPSCSVQV